MERGRARPQYQNLKGRLTHAAIRLADPQRCIVGRHRRPAYHADLGLHNGRIAAIGQDLGIAAQQIDADGLLVTPGFGMCIPYPLTVRRPGMKGFWPSSQQGVTTAVIGNRGVGFALPGPEDRDTLIAPHGGRGRHPRHRAA